MIKKTKSATRPLKTLSADEAGEEESVPALPSFFLPAPANDIIAQAKDTIIIVIIVIILTSKP